MICLTDRTHTKAWLHFQTEFPLVPHRPLSDGGGLAFKKHAELQTDETSVGVAPPLPDGGSCWVDLLTKA